MNSKWKRMQQAGQPKDFAPGPQQTVSVSVFALYMCYYICILHLYLQLYPSACDVMVIQPWPAAVVDGQSYS